MKTLAALLVTLTLIQTASAALHNSILEKRHQDLIEKAAMEECQMTTGYIVETKTITTPIKVDNGIVDYTYETTLEARESIYDTYILYISSSYSDSYDHESKEWGSYSINSVSPCIQK